MPGPILPISAPIIPEVAAPSGLATSPAAAGGGGFAQVLAGAIGKVEGLGQDASASVQRFLGGETEDLHSTILAVTQAELSFDLFLQTRNKVVSAYQEIMRMQM
jgi:flagellar hook-basal body complex protein FliE